MIKTIEEIRKVVKYEQQYGTQLSCKIRIFTKDNPNAYVGNIIDNIIEQVEISDTNGNARERVDVPITFKFEIDEPTPNNGEIIEIDAFSITDIEYLSVHYHGL